MRAIEGLKAIESASLNFFARIDSLPSKNLRVNSIKAPVDCLRRRQLDQSYQPDDMHYERRGFVTRLGRGGCQQVTKSLSLHFTWVTVVEYMHCSHSIKSPTKGAHVDASDYSSRTTIRPTTPPPTARKAASLDYSPRNAVRSKQIITVILFPTPAQLTLLLPLLLRYAATLELITLDLRLTRLGVKPAEAPSILTAYSCLDATQKFRNDQ